MEIQLKVAGSKNMESTLEPSTPTGLYLSSPLCSPIILGIWESEVPIDDSQTFSLLQDVFIPINPRFSSIMVSDENGMKYWKKVEVHVKDHINIPKFQKEMPIEFYDKCFDNYLSTIAREKLPQDRPLWEIHIFKYPTSNAAGHLIFKIHHSIGDGYSLLAALFSCLKRADDPSLPLTFPTIQLRPTSEGQVNGFFRSLTMMFSTAYNTVTDFVGSFRKSNCVEDEISPIRSGVEGVEFLPLSIFSVTFSLDDIKKIKANHGLTINDVITGIVFMGTRAYMREMNPESGSSNSTAVVLLSTRMLRSYTSVEDMTKPKTKSPWGNHFAFLDVAIPKVGHNEIDRPLEFLKRIHEMIKRKRSSMAVYLIGWLLDTIGKIRGPEASSKYLYNTLKNTSMIITNVIGPVEKMALANHPVKGLYFMLAGGVPQSLTITIISYMGQLRVAIGAQKDFIDPSKYKACLMDSFELMLEASSR